MKTVITSTSKGHRIWLQRLASHGITGTRCNVTYGNDHIAITVVPEGKRSITQAKGGIVDLQSKRVTHWARGATHAEVEFVADSLILIKRIEA